MVEGRTEFPTAEAAAAPISPSVMPSPVVPSFEGDVGVVSPVHSPSNHWAMFTLSTRSSMRYRVAEYCSALSPTICSSVICRVLVLPLVKYVSMKLSAFATLPMASELMSFLLRAGS